MAYRWGTLLHRRINSLTTVISIDRHLTITAWIICVVVCILHIPPRIEAFQCDSCNRSLCHEPDNCLGGLAVDPCGCCRICSKVEEELCGGMYGLNGRCDRGLYCSITPQYGTPITGQEDGVCKAIKADPFLTCDHVECTQVIESQCADDSISLGGALDPDGCCPTPFYCECMPCLDTGAACLEGQSRFLTKLGIGQPGDCCDVYECEDREDLCLDVECDADPFVNITCPEDSKPLTPLLTQNGCCTQHAGCVCLPPDQCEIPICLPGTRPQLVMPSNGLPGRCCNQIECVSESLVRCPAGNNTWRDNGDLWQLDACTACTCFNGITKCNQIQCPVLDHCGWISIPEGECCHKCMGCTKGSMTYANGDEWQQDSDSCVTCYCEDGQVYCRAELCFITCDNPRKLPGVCCPVCDDEPFYELPSGCESLENCTLLHHCPLGLAVDDRGCSECRCKDDIVLEMIPELCDLDCPLGYKLDPEGIERCECLTTTSSTSTTPSTPTTSTTPGDWPIEVVTPSDSPSPTDDKNFLPGTVICPSMEFCNKDCVYGFRVGRDGCPKCKCNRCPPFLCHKKCVHGYSYNDNGCVLCKCRDNSTQQDVVTEPPDSPPDHVQEGTCLTDAGRLREDGESWHDGCRHCFCHLGREMCTLITCPVPHCWNPVLQDGDCCATCPDETDLGLPAVATRCQANGGMHVAEGETWVVDKCTLCICHSGEMMCEAERCPPPTCHRPIKVPERCCPVCLDELEPPPSLPNHTPGAMCQVLQGVVFSSGDIWRVSACQSCACQDGQIHCFSQTCPLLPKCNKTITRKGQCCPQCIEEETSTVCALGGETYASGESWLLNNCTHCTCMKGRILCVETQCPRLVNCARTSYMPDSCCPVCTEHIPYDEDEDSSKGSHFVGYVVAIVVLVVVVFVLVLVVGLLCWRKKKQRALKNKQKEQEMCQRTKFMQAMFQSTAPSHRDLIKRPKSVNLEYRGHNPIAREYPYRMDYRNRPEPNKLHYYDETEGLLTTRSKMSDAESVNQGCVTQPLERGLCEKDELTKDTPNTNNLNAFHQMGDNYNINCNSSSVGSSLAKPYKDTGNDLTGGSMDKLSEFDNAACISSSCSDFAIDKTGLYVDSQARPACNTCERKPSSAQDQCANITVDNSDLLLDDSAQDNRGQTTNIPVQGVPTRDHPPNIPARSVDKHTRYSVNDDVWLRNSSRDSAHEKAPMGDKNIRYSVGAENHTQADPELLGVPQVCDTNSYRKSL